MCSDLVPGCTLLYPPALRIPKQINAHDMDQINSKE